MSTAMQKGLLLVLSGPSGAGKGTVVKELFRRNPAIRISVSATTRAPRAGELDGEDYFFVSMETFQEMIDDDAFMEYAQVHGNLYGTPFENVNSMLSKGVDVVLEIDPQGAMQVKKTCKEAIFVFLLPPSRADLESRLRGRASETEAQIAVRLQNSVNELTYTPEYEYAVINGDLDNAVTSIEAILTAERCRISRGAHLLMEDFLT